MLEATHVSSRFFEVKDVVRNGIDERWELDGAPVDMSDQGYSAHPHLNAYRVQPKPIL
jgi:hypothetical protein